MGLALGHAVRTLGGHSPSTRGPQRTESLTRLHACDQEAGARPRVTRGRTMTRCPNATPREGCWDDAFLSVFTWTSLVVYTAITLTLKYVSFLFLLTANWLQNIFHKLVSIKYTSLLLTQIELFYTYYMLMCSVMANSLRPHGL